MKKGKKWKELSIALMGIGSSFLLGAGVLGYWKQTGNTLNILSTASFQNKIVEEYKTPEPIIPGDQVEKIVNVSNTGNVDSLIRVAVKKAFGDEQKDGTFLADTSLDPKVIDINYSDTWWEKGNDGYFYYKDILKAGQTTREPLMRRYKFSEKAGNEYKGKKARIIVTMEAMQADMDPEKIWGISAKKLGIQIAEEGIGKQTQVVYAGKNGGFQIAESTTDLFASFKKLTPGCARTQSIVVENRSEESVEIFLRAEEAEQESMSERQREQIRRLLQQDAIIQIKNGSQELYHGPISGYSAGGTLNMQQDMSLGTFSGNMKKNLIVTLELNPNMDIQSGNLTGKIRWIFTAKGEDGNVITAQSVTGQSLMGQSITAQSVPVTGDYTSIAIWILLLAGSFCVISGMILSEKRMEK